MAVIDPPWKVKVRPCPFYSRGRCIFAESCAFQHGIKIKPYETKYAQVLDSEELPCDDSPVEEPELDSPSFSRLLIALKGVIDEDEDADEGFEEYVPRRTSRPSSSSAEGHSENFVSSALVSALEDTWASATQEERAFRASLLSPVAMSDTSLIHFERREDSMDSGYEGSWHGPHPLARTPPVDEGSFGSGNSNLSLTDLISSPFGLPKLLSPRLSAFITRGPVLPIEEDEKHDLLSDLESPEATRAQPLESTLTAKDVAETANRESTGEIIAWDSYRGEPTAVYVGLSSVEATTLNTPDAAQNLDYDEGEFSPESHSTFIGQKELDSILEPEYEEEEEEDLSNNPSFDNRFEESINQAVGLPELSEQELQNEAELDALTSPTAELAYLGNNDTITLPNENDTLTSFYDVYSAFPTNKNNQPLSPVVASPAYSTPVDRGRVFTPPLTRRERSGTITVDSPTLANSPGIFSSPEAANLPLDGPQEVVVSTKVPFGFRQSLILGRAGNSALAANRLSRSTTTPLPESPIAAAPSSPLLESPVSSPRTTRSHLKPLRLSVMLTSPITPSPLSSASSSFSINNSYQVSHRASTNVTLTSDSQNRQPLLLSPASTGHNILTNSHEHNTNPTPKSASAAIPVFSVHGQRPISFQAPQSAPLSRSRAWRLSVSSHGWNDPINLNQEEDEEEEHKDTALIHAPHTAPPSQPVHTLDEPFPRPMSATPLTHAIATPLPTLMFALASDDVQQVLKVLQSGVSPNEAVGPQSALAFAMSNDQLTHRMEIVKILLAFGADPTSLKNPDQNPPHKLSLSRSGTPPLINELLEGMDPATSYHVARADAALTRRTSALIHRSFFRPLTRVRYELVGQDRALEQLFKALSFHSLQVAVAPIVVLLCGPSGHGKSLLARHFGALLDVPTHTVNLTTITSPHDIWKSYSMSLNDESSSCTLAEFLINNEGKRCVVVLDEIEKTDIVNLRALLMPWEGRCSLEAGSRNVDVRNVIWLGTCNIGDQLIFDYHHSRENPEEIMSREEYMDLTRLLRPQVAAQLGAPVLSRVTTVLPFCPFSIEERRAIAAEALFSLGAGMDTVKNISSLQVDNVVREALLGYAPAEGARSLYRAVSTQLVDL